VRGRRLRRDHRGPPAGRTQRGLRRHRDLCRQHIYYTVNNVHRQPVFHGGTDLRKRPFALMRTPVKAAPVRLGL
jgi:hypothetical protein